VLEDFADGFRGLTHVFVLLAQGFVSLHSQYSSYSLCPVGGGFTSIKSSPRATLIFRISCVAFKNVRIGRNIDEGIN
jgi:hypothetical protein